VWVDRKLKLTFRRTFSEDMMHNWDDLVAVVEQITLNEDLDALIWSYNSTGIYSSSSLYSIISFRGFSSIYSCCLGHNITTKDSSIFLAPIPK
jgi:hypothetical protein